MGGFSPTYSVGGVLDEIKKINFPDHLFPSLSRPFTKGFRLEVPPVKGMFSVSYIPPFDVELIDVGLACSGYSDGDYWELMVGTEKIMETIYSKELPQHINTGSTLYVVQRIAAGTEIKMMFMNETASTKSVWFDLRFLK